MKNFLLCLGILGYSVTINAQDKWQDLREQGANFYEIEQAFDEEWKNKEYERGRGYSLFQRWKYFMEPRMSLSGDINISKHYAEALSKNMRSKNSVLAKSTGDWSPLGFTSWETEAHNPGNGRVDVIVQDPNVSNRYYIGTPSGGLWVTHDGFETWQPLAEELSSLGVSGICISPENSDVIYIATGDADSRYTYSIGVMKSIDGGQSWQTTGLSHLVTSEVRINKLIMHPNDPETLFAATKSGLWKTTTGGEVWYEVLMGITNDIEFKPGDPSTIYCCTDRIYKSIDGGESFSDSSEGMPAFSKIGGIELAVTEAEPDYLYALCVERTTNGFLGVYRSEDSAENFEVRAENDGVNVLGNLPDGSSEGGQGLYNLAFDIDPKNGERFYLGGVNVWESIDGGESFTVNSDWRYSANMTLNYVHSDIHYITFIDNAIFVCSDGGVYRSTNGGEDFTDLSEGLQISQFYRIGGYELNEDLLLGGTQDNGSFRYSGSTWTHERGGDGMEAAIHPADPDIMYVSTQRGRIRGSTNGGGTWTNSFVSPDFDQGGWVTPYVLDPLSTETIFVGCTEIWKSDDNGNLYEKVSNVDSGSFFVDMAISASNPSIIYAGKARTLYKTSNSGESWEICFENLALPSMTYVDINPANENDVVITYSGFREGEKVFRTLDGGQNWENISGNLPNIPVNCVAIDADDGSLYVGTDLGVYYLDDQLQGWIPFNEGMPNVIITEIEINNLTGQLTAATFGRGIWRSDQFKDIQEPPVALFEADKRIICAGESVSFRDLSFGHTPEWNWNFEGADITSSTEKAPSIAYYNPGFYEVSLTVSNPLGETTHTESSYIYVQAASESYPYSEDFEVGSDLEAFEFKSVAKEGNAQWQLSTSAGYDSSQSIWVNNGFLDEPYETELYSKQFDFSSITHPIWLTFRYAYAQKHEGNDEILKFFVSRNCNETYELKKQLKGTQELNTLENVFLENFTPHEPWHWKTFSYEIEGNELSETFAFKLLLEGDNGNHVYIDNINIGEINLSTNGVEEFNELWMFPNPAEDELNVQFYMHESGTAELVNAHGQKVKVLDNIRAGSNSLKIETAELSSGVYYLNLVSQNGVRLVTKKVVIN